MNERKLRLLFERTLLITTPLLVSLGSAACGGATEPDDPGEGSGGSTADGGTAGKGGSAGSAGKGGSGAVGGSAGAGAVGGTVATGGFGAVAGSAGAGAGGAGGVAGTGGSAGGGGAGGEGGACSAPPKSCFDTTTAELPIACIDDPNVAPDDAECAAFCPTTDGGSALYGDCTVTASNAETFTITCHMTCFVGRRPTSFVSEPCPDDDLGGYFAGIAKLEAASVFAFRGLRSELRAHGAPKRLLAALGRAARDEVRHARSTRALTRRYRGAVQAELKPQPAARSLEAIAIENVREGCVRETFGALLAHHHAQEARDPVVRSAMQRIARDETRHAAASFAVQHWLESRLDPPARARVRAAREAALEELSAEIAVPPPRDPDSLIGFPDASRARSLFGELERSLWMRGA